LADLEQVKVTDTGKVEGMAEAIEALAKKYPYLLRDDDDTDSDYDIDKFPEEATASGRPMNRQRKTSADPKTSDAALYRRYPALRRGR